MAKRSASFDIKKITANLSKALIEAASPVVYKRLGSFTIGLVVKRTRLGYGVDKFLGKKERLIPLSDKYVEQRKRSKLSSLTSPKKSNLTRTSKMLDSLKILKVNTKSVIIGPSGDRSDTDATNAEIAFYNEVNGRTFLNISALEFKQVVREYRRSFGDLLKKRRLLK